MMNLPPCLFRASGNAIAVATLIQQTLFRLLVLFAMASTQVQAQTSINLIPGWNLLGNSSATSIDVKATLGDATKIVTVWTWNKTTSKWAFYAPSMSSDALATYAQGKGYDVLTNIAPKEGFWVNATTSFVLAAPTAAGVMLTATDLQPGWNLMSSADSKTPSQLNASLSSSLNSAITGEGKRIVTAWAWQASTSKWKFYAPSLEAQGGTALGDYIDSKDYLQFSAALSPSDGFWINIGSVDTPPMIMVSTFAGTIGKNGLIDGIGLLARFNAPQGITSDGTNLYVADTYSSTIRKIVISSGKVTTLAGSATLQGSTDGIGSAARFAGPWGLTNIGNNLFVVDNNNIRKIDISTGNVTTLAGSGGAYGSVDGIGNAAGFNFPHGITTDGTSLYVADYGNHAIRKIVIATGEVTTFAGSSAPFESGYVDAIGTSARFSRVSGITSDGANLYVIDQDNGLVRKIEIATRMVTTLAGSSTVGYAHDGIGAGARFHFGVEYGITNDGTNIYLTDDQPAGTVRKIVISTGEVTTIAGVPASAARPLPQGSTDGLGASALFYGAGGICLVGNSLYLTDTWNHTIRKIQ